MITNPTEIFNQAIQSLPPSISEPKKEITSSSSKIAQWLLREGGLIALSAAFGYMGAKASEVPINAVSGLASWLGYTQNPGWIELNAPGMALYTAATVPLLQLTNSLFHQTVNLDGSRKQVFFSSTDTMNMVKAGFTSYLMTKTLELPANLVSKVFGPYRHAIDPASTFMSIGGGIALGKGLYDYSTTPENQSKAISLTTMITGATTLALSGLKMTYNLLYSEPAKNLNTWTWSYVGAPAFASRAALSIPIQLIANQVLGSFMSNPNVPEMVHKVVEIASTSATAVASMYIASMLELPGVSPIDDVSVLAFEIFKQVAFTTGAPWILQKLIASLENEQQKMVSLADIDTEESQRLAQYLQEKLTEEGGTPAKSLG